MARALCTEMESALQDYKCSSLISALVKPVQDHLQTLQRLFFFKSTSSACLYEELVSLSLVIRRL